MYYLEQAPGYIIPDGHCPSEDADHTNEACFASHGVSIAGHVAPTRELDGDEGEIAKLRALALGMRGMVFEVSSAPSESIQPQLFVNIGTRDGQQIAYYAVLGNSTAFGGVELFIDGTTYRPEELVGEIELGILPLGSQSFVGNLLDNEGNTLDDSQLSGAVQVPIVSRFRVKEIARQLSIKSTT